MPKPLEINLSLAQEFELQRIITEVQKIQANDTQAVEDLKKNVIDLARQVFLHKNINNQLIKNSLEKDCQII